MKAALIFSSTILICSVFLRGAEEGTVFRDFKIDSTFANGASWSVQDGSGILHIALPSMENGLPLPESPSIQIWLLQPDGSSTKPSSNSGPMGVSMTGFTTPMMMYEFPPTATAKAVAVVVQVEGKFFVFPLIPEKNPAEQAGAGQPATRSESGSKGADKPQPESDGRSR